MGITRQVSVGVSDIRSRVANLCGYADRLGTARSALIVIALSFFVKLAYVHFGAGGLESFPSEGTDGSVFDLAARTLLTHGLYATEPSRPILQPPPGEAFFLAGLYAVSGHSLVFAKLAHIALLTFVAVIVYFTGKLMFTPAVGLLAGVLVAIDPGQAYLSGTFLSEPLFMTLMCAGIYLLLRTRQSSFSSWMALGAGLIFGLASLTRNQGAMFVAIMLCGALITRGRMLSLKIGGIAAVSALLLVLPWTYRNYRVSGHFVPISTNGGLTLWSGNNPDFDWRQPMPMSLPIYRAPTGLTDYELDRYYRSRAMQWIWEHPFRFVLNGIKKLIMLYSFDPASVRPEMLWIFRLAGLVPYGLFLPLILLGIRAAIRDPRTWLLVGYIGLITLVAFVYWGDSRVRAPIQPYLYLLAASWLVARVCTRQVFESGATLVVPDRQLTRSQ